MKYTVSRNNDLFDDIFDNMFRTPTTYNQAVMKTDVHEKDGKYILEVEIPGYKKEDVKISLFNGTLTINAEHNETNEEKDAKGRILRQERYSGTCSRSFYVGDAIKDTDVKASFENGILKIEIPTEQKKEEETKKFIDIL
ncbi:MAG: Hsp20/alpha crystallin family protein [Erysipelotrichaceae bacterium]|jgi:HSP20 family molecular chaperone IbpA|nr:Hsp20/alpha crystallin family protein [Erysipelotrichaceae bacterium]